MRLGAARHSVAKYRAAPVNAYVRPLAGTPWSLVVFADKRHLTYLGFETLTFAGVIADTHLVLPLVARDLPNERVTAAQQLQDLSVGGVDHGSQDGKGPRPFGGVLLHGLVSGGQTATIGHPGRKNG